MQAARLVVRETTLSPSPAITAMGKVSSAWRALRQPACGRHHQAAEFSTMVPHRIGAVPDSGDLEILSIFNRDGERAHLHNA